MSNLIPTPERSSSTQRRGALIAVAAAASAAVAAAAVVIALQVGGGPAESAQSSSQTTQQQAPQVRPDQAGRRRAVTAATRRAGGSGGQAENPHPAAGRVAASTDEAPAGQQAYGDGVLSFDEVTSDLDRRSRGPSTSSPCRCSTTTGRYIGSSGWVPLNGYAGVAPGSQLYCDGAPITDGDGLHSFHDNAMYCAPDDDVSFGDGRADLHDYIVYDTQFLRDTVLAQYGDMAVTFVLAHEYGHAAQARFGWVTGESGAAGESNADCLAGTFIRWLYDNGSSTRARGRPARAVHPDARRLRRQRQPWRPRQPGGPRRRGRVRLRQRRGGLPAYIA